METHVLTKINNLKISAKIYLLSGGLLTALIVTAGVGILKMQQIEHEIVGLAEREVPLTKALTAVTTHQLEQAVAFQRAIGWARTSRAAAPNGSRIWSSGSRP